MWINQIKASIFFCFFYFIPYFCFQLCIIVFSISLSLVSLFFILKKKSKLGGLILLFLISLALFGFSNSKTNRFSIYKSEGILGKLEIRDEPAYNNSSIIVRELLINNTIQTEMNLETMESVSEYVRLLKKKLLYFPIW